MNSTNGVMIQFYHWYTPADGRLWRELAEKAPRLAQAGVSSVWLPPAYKGSGGGMDVGYGVYDLFDLGEFDQKGSVRTKYGTKDEYLEAIKQCKEVDIRVYADVVFNHKMGADGEEEMEGTPVNAENRRDVLGESRPIKAWTHFTFPGRQQKYSSMAWHWWHFTAIDHNALDDDDNVIYLLQGKDFGRNVDLEKGNYDYLMGCNLDVAHPEVVGELKYWGEWLLDTTELDGFRFDAVKHVDAGFFQEWLEHVRTSKNPELFAVGEYWSYEINALQHFIASTGGTIHLFDAPLHMNFHQASRAGADYDLRGIFEGSLVSQQPTLSVTLVDNHDTQPLQALESPVESWFKPLAYALILLRADGYPCIFYADYYGAEYSDTGSDGEEHTIVLGEHNWIIDKMLAARRDFAYGDQVDYFDHAKVIGWTRLGSDEHPGGLAVLLSNSQDGHKQMQLLPNSSYRDATEHITDEITTDDKGWGEFHCPGGKVSVWVPTSS